MPSTARAIACTILDFDDTLFPTSVFHDELDIENFDQLQDDPMKKSVMEALASLVSHILELFDTTKVPIAIISNGSITWVLGVLYGRYSKTIGSILKPLRCRIRSEQIPIISARTEWFKANGNLPFNGIEAKKVAMQEWLQQIYPLGIRNSHVSHIRCIGDGEDEFIASEQAVKQIFKGRMYFLQRFRMKASAREDGVCRIQQMENQIKGIIQCVSKYYGEKVVNIVLKNGGQYLESKTME
eukprot:134497_1